MNQLQRMQVLLVEDEPQDLEQYQRDLPSVFEKRDIQADLHTCDNFDEALQRSSNPLHRYDLIISDTYRGSAGAGDAAVLKMVESYRGHRFCPLVVYSSGTKPPDLKEGPFLRWADKAKSGDIESAINALIDTNVPQLARTMHDELETSAGSYLWGFLEENWDQLNSPNKLDNKVLERIVRRRASIQIGDVDPESGEGLLEKDAAEYYIYPAFDHSHYNLGDVVRSQEDSSDFRIILTPHCHLFIQLGQDRPRADHVLLAKMLPADEVLGDRLDKAKSESAPKQKKRLLSWGQSPSKNDVQPAGRHWYLPSFVDIPHSFCDFMQVESLKYDELESQYRRVATLTPPYAEALQSCFAGFYASVGIPVVRTESVMDILD